MSLVHVLIRFALEKKYKIGERREFWGRLRTILILLVV